MAQPIKPPVRVNIARLLEVAAVEQDLAPAFVAATQIDAAALERLSQDGSLDKKYEYWLNREETYCGDSEARYPAAAEVFRLIERSPERVLTIFVWQSMVAGAYTFMLVRDLGGSDLLYADDGESGYPIQLTRPTSQPGLADAITTAICVNAGFFQGATITNWRPDLVDGQRIYRVLEEEMGDAAGDFWNENYAEERS